MSADALRAPVTLRGPGINRQMPVPAGGIPSSSVRENLSFTASAIGQGGEVARVQRPSEASPRYSR